MENIRSSKGFSNLQLELLKLYATDVSEKNLLEIKKLLANFFAKKVDEEMDALWEEKDWGMEKIEEWKNGHYRKSSK
jgi:hypothetical protein